MDELDIFRDFRSGIAAPDNDAEQRAALRLKNAIESGPGRAARVLRTLRRRPRRTTLAIAAVAGAVVAALFVSTPWKSSPGLLEPAEAARFLERAEAALDAVLEQGAGTIVHFDADWSRTSTRFGCTVTTSREEWVDNLSSHGWRVVHSGTGIVRDDAWFEAADLRTIACSEWPASESGGAALEGNAAPGRFRMLTFVPPNTLRVEPGYGIKDGGDPIAFLRGLLHEVLQSGRGHDEGMTDIDGRAVRRFRIDCRPPPDPSLMPPPPPGSPPPPPPVACTRPDYLYMDSETFLPVQWVSPAGFLYGDPVTGEYFRYDVVWRFHAIEYLPRTPANVALTDIRAQHPDAKLVPAKEER